MTTLFENKIISLDESTQYNLDTGELIRNDRPVRQLPPARRVLFNILVQNSSIAITDGQLQKEAYGEVMYERDYIPATIRRLRKDLQLCNPTLSNRLERVKFVGSRWR